MNKTIMMNTALLLCIALAAGQVDASPPQSADANDRLDRPHRSDDGFGMPGMMTDRMIERLGLDEEQADAVRKVMDAARPEFDALRDRGGAVRSSIRALDPDESGYQASLKDLSAEAGQVAADLVLLSGRVRAEIHALLTPEQRESLSEMSSRFEGRRRREP